MTISALKKLPLNSRNFVSQKLKPEVSASRRRVLNSAEKSPDRWVKGVEAGVAFAAVSNQQCRSKDAEGGRFDGDAPGAFSGGTGTISGEIPALC